LISHIEQNFERIESALGECSNGSGYGREGDFGPLLTALKAELQGQRDAFLAALDEFLDSDGVPNDKFDAVQLAIGLLRGEFVSVGAVQLEELWDSARRIIALANSRWQIEQRAALELTYQRLLGCSERLSGVSGLPGLGDVLSQGLAKVPINNALVALSAGGANSELETLLKLPDGQALEPAPDPIAAAKLLSVATPNPHYRKTRQRPRSRFR
jgi:hypothetical protein